MKEYATHTAILAGEHTSLVPKTDKWWYFFIQLLLKAPFWLPIRQFDHLLSYIGETNRIIDNLNVVGPWYKCWSNRWKLNLHITHCSPHGQALGHNFPIGCLAQTLKLFGHFLSDAFLADMGSSSPSNMCSKPLSDTSGLTDTVYLVHPIPEFKP